MKKLSSFFIVLLLSVAGAFAQDGKAGPASVPMADEMYASGRIYVVIVTIAIVFVGLAIYLFSMDRRLKRLEKERDI